LLDIPDQSGRTIVLTGATSGVGLESAVQLARANARVIVVGRDKSRTDAAAEQVRTRAGRGDVGVALCDFSSQASIRTFAADVRGRVDHIDVLLNNAGGVSDTRQLTVDGIEQTFAVNHLGYFLTTHLLLDLVQRAPAGRVVNVASTGHYRATLDLSDVGFERGGYTIMGAYRRSKLANVLFTRSLAKRLERAGVTVNALHPGGVATNIWSKAPGWTQPILWLAKLFMLTPEQGGETLTYLAASPEVAGKTGGYYERNRAIEPDPLARDESLAEQLWALSEQLVGIRPGRFGLPD
jgi:NAD(P)-dependent dehydrogenase (short-subunit alcohol dehydrogenase family)